MKEKRIKALVRAVIIIIIIFNVGNILFKYLCEIAIIIQATY